MKVFAMAGRKPRLRIIGKTVLRIMGVFSPFMREFVEMHYLQIFPVLMDDRVLVQLLGVRGKWVEVTADRLTHQFVGRGELSFDIVVNGNSFCGTSSVSVLRRERHSDARPDQCRARRRARLAAVARGRLTGRT